MPVTSDDGGVTLPSMDNSQEGINADCLPKLLANSRLSSPSKLTPPLREKRNPYRMAEQSNSTTATFCDLCERQFCTKGGLRSHIRDSKVHQAKAAGLKVKEVLRQKATSESAPSSLDSMANETNTIPTVSDMDDSSPKNSLGSQNRNLLLSFIGAQFEDTDTDSFDNGLADLLDSMLATDDCSSVLTTAYSKSVLPVVGLQEVNFKTGHKWSPVPVEVQPQIIKVLQKHCHSAEDLSKRGYRLRPYVPHEIAGFARCKKCGSQKKRAGKGICRFHTGGKSTEYVEGKRVWLCCGKDDKGCVHADHHEYMNLEPETIAKYKQYGPTPKNLRGLPRRKAVALDCEMAGVEGNRNELIQVCVVDYVTGDVLLDTLVEPLGKVVDWRTRCHGVTVDVMRDAVAQGKTLKGWKEARRELWTFIDWDTVIVGSALHNDLDVLGIIHSNIVDSELLASKEIGPLCSQNWGLKTMCDELLRIPIQMKGKSGHECLEDAFASREIVLWCTCNPVEFRVWARVKTEEEQLKLQQREVEKKRREWEKQKEKEKRILEASKKRKVESEDEDDDDDEESSEGPLGPDGLRKRRDSVLYGYLGVNPASTE